MAYQVAFQAFAVGAVERATEALAELVPSDQRDQHQRRLRQAAAEKRLLCPLSGPMKQLLTRVTACKRALD